MTVAEKLARVKTDLDDVYEAGRELEYDKMWDVIQPEGSGNYYHTSGIFNGRMWNSYNFFPKRDIRPVGRAAYLFYDWEEAFYGPNIDLKQRLIDCGVVLDTSQATDLSYMFYYSAKFTVIPTIDFTGLTTNSYNVFARTWNLKTIEKIIINENVYMPNWFENALRLENIVFEGVIGQNLDMNWSTLLTKASITNILDTLSASVSGKTLTLSKTAVNNAFTTDEWTALANTRTNWTISLV